MLLEKFEVDRKESKVRAFIKEGLGYSYKRGWSRPSANKQRNSKLLQSIFSSRMLESLYEDVLLINVDESCYSRSIKTSYSWLPKGVSSPIINTNHAGQATLILGLWSNGEWCLSYQKRDD